MLLCLDATYCFTTVYTGVRLENTMTQAEDSPYARISVVEIVVIH